MVFYILPNFLKLFEHCVPRNQDVCHENGYSDRDSNGSHVAGNTPSMVDIR